MQMVSVRLDESRPKPPSGCTRARADQPPGPVASEPGDDAREHGAEPQDVRLSATPADHVRPPENRRPVMNQGQLRFFPV